MTSSRQIEQTAATWLARRDAGDWSAAEQAALDAWLEATTAHRVAFLRLESAWQEAGRLQALGAGLRSGELPPRGRWTQPQAIEPTDDIVTPGIRPTTYKRRTTHAPMWKRWPAGIAAALLLLTLGAGIAWQRHAEISTTNYATAVGKLAAVTLVDGSQATLSSDSRIQVVWSQRQRHIDLQQGEAFFSVAKNPDKPFVVAAGDRQVVAVGTRFAVRRDEGQLRVVVTEGVVRLEPLGADGHSSSATLLPAGSVAQLDDHGLLVRSLPLEQAEQYLDWRDGYVSFHNTPLAVAVNELNRYSSRKIVVADPTIASLPLGGNFRWSNTDAFVRLLEAGFPVRAEQQGDRIVLRSR
ncbi:FecR family protein [Dyella sp. 20L07]|uniref:FecR family protein n=1 Tax=Dyella sp. 20L07 TaxID=3384240 RepID=UPI003D27F5C9